MSDIWREVVAEWRGEFSFIGSNESGGRVQMGMLDGVPGVSPMEMLLLGIAGCTGADIVSILTKQRQNIAAFRVQVRGKRTDEHPKIYTEIEVTYHLWGDGLDPISVERAIALSEEKYCSASAMMRSVAQIRSTYILYSPEESS